MYKALINGLSAFNCELLVTCLCFVYFKDGISAWIRVYGYGAGSGLVITWFSFGFDIVDADRVRF